MPPVVIDNPILNSPFREPARHFRFDDDGITNEIAEGRRRSMYFIPIPKPRTTGGAQLSLPGDWVAERMTDNDFINRVREHVGASSRLREGSTMRSPNEPGLRVTGKLASTTSYSARCPDAAQVRTE